MIFGVFSVIFVANLMIFEKNVKITKIKHKTQKYRDFCKKKSYFFKTF